MTSAQVPVLYMLMCVLGPYSWKVTENIDHAAVFEPLTSSINSPQLLYPVLVNVNMSVCFGSNSDSENLIYNHYNYHSCYAQYL